MIIVNIEGRLGNQLFQYAFAFATAKRLKTGFNFHILYPHIYTFIIEKYFELPSYNFFWGRVVRFCFRKLGQTLFPVQEVSLTELTPVGKLKNNTRFGGFFQSEIFFTNYIDAIKNEFSLRKKYVDEFNSLFREILEENKIVVIHIRLTDYIEIGSSLPISYYKSCLSRIPNLDEYEVFVVSDDIDLAKKHLDQGQGFYFQKNSEIIDFQLLQHADIAIISNSSFSWWAGYLNNKSNKIVFAPKYWLGFKEKKEYPIGVMDNDFTWVDVDHAAIPSK